MQLDCCIFDFDLTLRHQVFRVLHSPDLTRMSIFDFRSLNTHRLLGISRSILFVFAVL